MTITAQTSKTGPYNGNGTTTVFSYTFEVQDEAHLVVTLADATGVETVQVLNTDYTVSGVGNPGGGQITMTTAPAASYTLTISRNVPITQEIDLENRRSVAPEVLEDAYDKLTQIAQDLNEQVGRSLKISVTESGAPNTSLQGDVVPGSFLGFGIDGNFSVLTPPSGTFISAGASLIAVDAFTGDGTTVDFTMGGIPAAAGNVFIFLDGVMQDAVNYSVSGTTLTFTTAPPLNTNIEVRRFQSVSLSPGATTADLVTYSPAGSGAQNTTVETKLREFVSVKDFGAVGDGVTDDTAAIQAAIDSISNAANLGRGGGTILLFPFGSYVISASLLIDQKNIDIQGDGSTITHSGASPAFLLGDVSYLSDFVTNNAYRVVSINNISIVLSNASGVGVKNNGVRKVLMENVYVRGGARGVELEAGWSGTRLRAVTCQLQSDRGFSILKRNNVICLEKCAALSGASVGFYISTDGAGPSGELHAVTLDQCDAEGCVTGYQVTGDNIGPVLLKNCWGELNTGNSVYVTGAAATNTYGVRIDGGQFDRDVVFGQTGGGRLRGCSIEGVNFSNASLRIYVTSGVEVGYNSYLGTGALVFQNGQPIGPAEYYAAAERQPLFAVGHGIPYQTNDSRGKIGELRWDNNFAYIKVGASAWHRSQLSSFGDGQVAPLPTGATPSTVGLRACRTANSGATTITSFPDGQDGQELIIIGGDSGNTTVAASAAKLPGGTPITLGNNDVLHLVCNQDVTPIWVCVSYSDNPA